jgi:hypothetical protein
VQFAAVDHQCQQSSFLLEAAEEAAAVVVEELHQQQPAQLKSQQQPEAALPIHRMQLVSLLWAVEDSQILKTLLESMSQSMGQSTPKALHAQS